MKRRHAVVLSGGVLAALVGVGGMVIVATPDGSGEGSSSFVDRLEDKFGNKFDLNDSSSEDTLADAGDVRVDLNNDGEPDTRLDINGDGDTEDDADTTIRTVTDFRTDVVSTLAPQGPETDPTEGLITPSGERWWTFVTATAAPLRIRDIPAPKANWYALTGQQQTVLNVANPGTYPALHIAFTDEPSAHRFADNTAVEQSNLAFRIRGPVVTIAPGWVDTEAEPFKADLARIEPLAKKRPTAATWTWRIGREQAYLISRSRPAWKPSLKAYYTSLGYSSDTTWSSVATDPEGPWNGRVTAFDLDAIDFDDAAAALVATVKNDCDTKANSGSCVETDSGLSPLADAATYATNNPLAVIGRNTVYLPKRPSKSAHVVFGIDRFATQGITNQTNAAYPSAVPLLQGWIAASNQMTMYTKRQKLPLQPVSRPGQAG